MCFGFVKKNLENRRYYGAAEKRLKDVQNGAWPEDSEQWIKKNLTHPSWQVRNIAVNVIRKGKLLEYSPDLIQFLTNESQVGFIRRNSAIALASFDKVDEAVIAAFIIGLEDPYWEVRTACAKGLATQGKPNFELTELIINKIYRKPIDKIPSYPIFRPKRIYREKNFEVRAALFRALGTVMAEKKHIHALEIPLEEDIWKVREAALKAFVSASQRLGYSSDQLKETLSRLDLTSTEFIPTYPIRQTLSTLSALQDDDTDNELNNQVKHHVV